MSQPPLRAAPMAVNPLGNVSGDIPAAWHMNGSTPHILLPGGGVGQRLLSGQVLYSNPLLVHRGSSPHGPIGTSLDTLEPLDSLTLDSLGTLFTSGQLAALMKQPGTLAGMPLTSSPSPAPMAPTGGLHAHMLAAASAPLPLPQQQQQEQQQQQQQPMLSMGPRSSSVMSGMLNTLGSNPDEASTSGISSLAEESGGVVAESTSVYIKNLPPEETELTLYRKFSPIGAVLSCKVLEDAATGRCRGVGFVNYGSAAEASKAVQKLNGARIGPGRVMQVVLQAPRAARVAAAAATAAAVGQSAVNNRPEAAALGPSSNLAAQFPGSRKATGSGGFSSGNSLQQQQMLGEVLLPNQRVFMSNATDALSYLGYCGSGMAATTGSSWSGSSWSPN